MGKKGKKGHGKHGSYGATHPHYKGQEFPSIEAAAVAAMHLLDVEDEEKHDWRGPAVASKKKSEREAPPKASPRNKTQTVYRNLIKNMAQVVERYRITEDGHGTCLEEEPEPEPEAPAAEELRGTHRVGKMRGTHAGHRKKKTMMRETECFLH